MKHSTSRSPSQDILSAALHVLEESARVRLTQEASEAVTEVGDLILNRARLVVRLRRAMEGTDVIATRLLGDQLQQCVTELEARLHERTQHALKLMSRRSA